MAQIYMYKEVDATGMAPCRRSKHSGDSASHHPATLLPWEWLLPFFVTRAFLVVGEDAKKAEREGREGGMSK